MLDYLSVSSDNSDTDSKIFNVRMRPFSMLMHTGGRTSISSFTRTTFCKVSTDTP